MTADSLCPIVPTLVLDKQWDQFDLIVGMDYLKHFEVAFRSGTFGEI